MAELLFVYAKILAPVWIIGGYLVLAIWKSTQRLRPRAFRVLPIAISIATVVPFTWSLTHGPPFPRPLVSDLWNSLLSGQWSGFPFLVFGAAFAISYCALLIGSALCRRSIAPK